MKSKLPAARTRVQTGSASPLFPGIRELSPPLGAMKQPHRPRFLITRRDAYGGCWYLHRCWNRVVAHFLSCCRSVMLPVWYAVRLCGILRTHIAAKHQSNIKTNHSNVQIHVLATGTRPEGSCREKEDAAQNEGYTVFSQIK